MGMPQSRIRPTFHLKGIGSGHHRCEATSLGILKLTVSARGGLGGVTTGNEEACMVLEMLEAFLEIRLILDRQHGIGQDESRLCGTDLLDASLIGVTGMRGASDRTTWTE